MDAFPVKPHHPISSLDTGLIVSVQVGVMATCVPPRTVPVGSTVLRCTAVVITIKCREIHPVVDGKRMPDCTLKRKHWHTKVRYFLRDSFGRGKTRLVAATLLARACFGTRASTIVVNTQFFAQRCCRVLPRTGNIAWDCNVALTKCPRFAGSRK